jgi:cell division inhibitor SulA
VLPSDQLLPRAHVRDANLTSRSVIDCFTKHLWVKALRTKEARVVAEWLTETFSDNPFEIWQSDNGGEFIASSTARRDILKPTARLNE